jgi:indolepyruvate ferredoxin oxidoreductase
VRRLERALIDEHRELMKSALELLKPTNADVVLAIAELPEMVRGYEKIKLASVDRYREAARDRLEELRLSAA